MGREAKLLLALLGLLSGGLVGVVAMKLFVPRPPVGAGPDIHYGDLAASEVQELVEPPAFSWPSTNDSNTFEVPRTPTSRFAAAEPEPRLEEPGNPIATPVPVRDPFVSPASFAPSSPDPVASADDLLPPPTDFSSPQTGLPPPQGERPPSPNERLPPPSPDHLPTAHGFESQAGGVDSSATSPTQVTAVGPMPVATLLGGPTNGMAEYVVQPGDSWWSLAERTYGDGRLYRALFAWNRGRDPRIAFVPGTRLDLPPLDRLATAWPALMPRE